MEVGNQTVEVGGINTDREDILLMHGYSQTDIGTILIKTDIWFKVTGFYQMVNGIIWEKTEPCT